ncbi:MAG: CAP domain-containing protein [Candidatus Velamenicoccus archaeovorus]
MVRRAVCLAVLLLLLLPTHAAALDALEQRAVDLTNATRVRNGLHELVVGARLTRYAERHAHEMAEQRRLFHSALRIPGYRSLGEIVGEGSTVRSVHRAFLRSPEHRRIMLGTWRRIGVGVARAGGLVYVVEIFAR